MAMDSIGCRGGKPSHAQKTGPTAGMCRSVVGTTRDCFDYLKTGTGPALPEVCQPRDDPKCIEFPEGV